jgi:glycogen(starch) synthase
MRIMLWSDMIWPHIGGVEVLAHQFTSELSKRGHEVLVITTMDSQNLSEDEILGNVRILRLRFREALQNNDPFLTVRLRQKIAREKEAFRPDIIHDFFQGPCTLFEYMTKDVAPAPRLATAHLFLTVESLPSSSPLRRSFEEADWVTACSASVLEDTVRQLPSIAGRATAILNGLASPYPEPSPLPHDQRILCIGRVVGEKGFDTAIEAVALLRDRYPALKLLIAGDGVHRPALEEHARRLALEDTVEFVGWVEPPAVPDLMRRCDIVLMPSIREPFGLVALEAACLERPLVGGKSGGLLEVVIDGETGLLADPLDAEANAAAIARLLDDHALAERLGRQARQHVLKTFEWGAFVDQYEALYERLAAGDRCS